MRIFLLVSLLLLNLTTMPSFAQDSPDLDAPFDPRAWTPSELAFIQTALAFSLDYRSVVDGVWGKRSRKALQAYFERAEESKYLDRITNLFALGIIIDAELEFRDSGWNNIYVEELDLTLFLPDVDYETTDGFIDVYLGVKENYIVEKFDSSKSAMQKYVWAQSKHFEILSEKRGKGIWLTLLRNERRAGYIISRHMSRTWNTVAFYFSIEDLHILNVLLTTMTWGEHPDMIELSPRLTNVTDEFLRQWRAAEQERDDYLSSETKQTHNQSENGNARAESTADQQEAKKPDQEAESNRDQQDENENRSSKIGTGTGFVVTEEGHVVTNAHVINECTGITVNGHETALLAKDEQFDLALLHTPSMPVTRTAVFSRSPARLNSDITIAGFPYHGVLGGLNITRGTVAAHKGLGGDGIDMQVTAPVQPGNSGGPAVNSAGNVVGVVASKLDAVSVIAATGDIPQNINFAIRGTIAQLFLHQNGVAAKIASTDTRISPEMIAELLSEYTVLVECTG
nr:serine protease [uncultured Roseibium sp.]